jgi:hypothetical protein
VDKHSTVTSQLIPIHQTKPAVHIPCMIPHSNKCPVPGELLHIHCTKPSKQFSYLEHKYSTLPLRVLFSANTKTFTLCHLSSPISKLFYVTPFPLLVLQCNDSLFQFRMIMKRPHHTLSLHRHVCSASLYYYTPCTRLSQQNLKI